MVAASTLEAGLRRQIGDVVFLLARRSPLANKPDLLARHRLNAVAMHAMTVALGDADTAGCKIAGQPAFGSPPPAHLSTALTKPEIAIEVIDRVIASGARFGCVLADSGYGSSGSFRQALSQRGLLWAVGLSRRQNVYRADTAEIFPVATTGLRHAHRVDDPVLRQKQPQADHHRHFARGQRHRYQRLTVGGLAERGRILGRNPDRMTALNRTGFPGGCLG